MLAYWETSFEMPKISLSISVISIWTVFLLAKKCFYSGKSETMISKNSKKDQIIVFIFELFVY